MFSLLQLSTQWWAWNALFVYSGTTDLKKPGMINTNEAKKRNIIKVNTVFLVKLSEVMIVVVAGHHVHD